jgi:hypothetical protein
MVSKLLPPTAAILALAITGSASAATTSMSFDSLVAAGYEIKAATPVTDAAAKQVFTTPNLVPQMLITLQKGNSVAVCDFAMVNWVVMDNATMANATSCATH